MHRHAWPLVSLRHFAGIHFTADGLLIRPGLPSHLGAFDYNTALVSVAWDGKETWKGRFALEHGRRSLRLVLDLSLALGDAGSSTISLERTDTHADSTTQERWQGVTRADGAVAAHLVADAATGEQVFEAGEMKPIFGGVAEGTLGCSSMGVHTDYKNVLVCNDGVFGALGFEGPWVAALNAMRQLEDKVVLKSVLS